MVKGSIVVGLHFGDEGKGATVDFLARSIREELGNAPLVIKSSSACQPEHNVVTPDGRHHTFSQIGAGAFAGSKTHIASNCLFEPISFLNELRSLQTTDRNILLPSWKSISVSPKARIITPFHKLANHVRYLDQAGECSSTGRGVWETVVASQAMPSEDVLLVEDLLLGAERVEYKLNLLETYYRNEGLEITDNLLRRVCPVSYLENVKYTTILADKLVGSTHFFEIKTDKQAIEGHEQVVFEQAQGVLLDADLTTMYPFVTGMNTTSDKSISLADELDIEIDRVYGCLRTYMTRHGAGVFPTEVDGTIHEEAHNSDQAMAGKFRQGYFDAVLSKFALRYDGGITHLSLSHCDVKLKTVRIPVEGSPDGRVVSMDPSNPEVVRQLLERPVGIIGSGQTAQDRKFLHA